MQWLAHSSLRYALVGISNTAVGFSVIWLAIRGFACSDVTANIAGFVIAFIWSFALNRRWTFRHTGAVTAGLFRYAVVCFLSYLANLSVVVLLSHRFGEGSMIVQVCGMATYSMLAYFGARVYCFRVEKTSIRGSA
jgi:putative flippase GtrA